MKIIFVLLQSSRKLFTIASLTSVLTGLCSMMTIRMIVEATKAENFDPASFLIEFGIYWVGYGVLALISTYTVSKLSQNIVYDLRLQLSEKILNAEFNTVERNQKRLMPILTEDIKTIAYGMDRFPSVTTGFATVIGLLAYIIYSSPILSLSVIVLFALVALVTRAFMPAYRRYQEIVRDLWNDVFHHFEGMVYGIKELSLNNQFKKSYVKDLIEPVSKAQRAAWIKDNAVAALSSKAGELVLLAGMAAMIVMIFNTEIVTMQQFTTFLTLVLFTLAPLSTVTGFWSVIKRIEVALEQVNAAGLEISRKKTSVAKSLSDEDTAGHPLISLEEVVHEYYNTEEDQNFELGPINLDIRKGEMIFLLGGNGSGKTTLAKILLGLYEPKSGMIKYNGQRIDDDYIQSYRDKYSAIFVDSYLFDQLVHVDSKAILERGQELIETLELTKKVKIEGKKFSTIRLSEGQKKRLALLVSILEDKDIYLFDEWAANQDPHFKGIFYHTILPQLKAAGKTIIVISHDEQYFEAGDRIIKLADGKLVETEALV